MYVGKLETKLNIPTASSELTTIISYRVTRRFYVYLIKRPAFDQRKSRIWHQLNPNNIIIASKMKYTREASDKSQRISNTSNARLKQDNKLLIGTTHVKS